MYNSYNNKRAVETFLVNAPGVDSIINQTEAGNRINNADGSVNISNGEIGIAVGDYAFDALGDTPAGRWASAGDGTLASIKIAQGTADSANPGLAYQQATYPLTARPLITSGNIDVTARPVIVRSNYQAPTNTVWTVGDTGSVATGGIQALDDTQYAITVAYRGRIADKSFGSRATAYFTPNYTTPNYTALGTAFPVDDLVQRLMWDVNRNSVITTSHRNDGNEPVVGLALDLTGTAGTLVSTMTAGFLPLVNTDAGVRGLTVDADLLATLQAALPTGSSIVTIDLTTAGTANTSQAFAILALDRSLAFADEMVQVKWDIDLGFRYGFDQNLVQKEQTSFPSEGINTYRQLEQMFQRTHNQRQYSGSHEQIPVIKYPSDILEDQEYTVFTIQHTNSAHVDTANTIVSPQKALVLFPGANTTAISEFDSAIRDIVQSYASFNGIQTA